GDLERRRRDAAADPPDQDPLARPELRPRDEHPERGLVDEREGGGGLERDPVGQRKDIRLGHRDQLSVGAVGVLADHGDRVAVLETGIDDDALAGVDPDAGAVSTKDARLRHRGKPLPHPEVEVVERRRTELHEPLARPGDGVGNLLVAEHLWAAVLMDPHCLHGHNPVMTTAELIRLGDELGLDAIGAAPAAHYAETERHIRERKERGLFATMGFTTRRPEVSCHPEQLLPGARTVISAALCYYADADDPGVGKGRLARYTW